ncbi:MAG TPA: TetR family transcriptional regulator [Solirubrobacteraceae bacterium]|nr:TetR family transcriptional regulator [Solirubrobacteraceae bacterium]
MDDKTRVGGNEGPPDDVPEPPDEAVLHQLISDELGESIAELMRQMRRAQEAWRRRTHPDEGLRERKRRLTRQLISDAATVLFAIHGFDNVKVADVADRVGVSEKTVYNYFPSKESLVLDSADETIESVAKALRERRPDESVTQAVVRALKDGLPDYSEFPDELVSFMPAFVKMIDSTPALHAAWLELHTRLAAVARDELASMAEVDPDDPEPMIAGRALAGLGDVVFESQIRHIEAGLRGEELRRAVIADLDRAARVIETGLWSFNLLARGARAKTQALEAARAAEEARTQVMNALKQARAAWAQVRDQTRASSREARTEARAVAQDVQEAGRQARAAEKAARASEKQALIAEKKARALERAQPRH